MAPLTRLVLLGCGGHASDVLGVVEATNERQPTYDLLGLLDDDPHADLGRFKGRDAPILGRLDRLHELEASWVAAVGWPNARRHIVEQAVATGRPPATLTSPLADIGYGVELGVGAVVMGGARLSPGSCLGDHSMVSYLAAIGHDTLVGACSSVMPGAMISGNVNVGANVLVGTNATVIEGVCVGDGATVGAGALVLEDVQKDSTVTGVPAKPHSQPSPWNSL